MIDFQFSFFIQTSRNCNVYTCRFRKTCTYCILFFTMQTFKDAKIDGSVALNCWYYVGRDLAMHVVLTLSIFVY